MFVPYDAIVCNRRVVIVDEKFSPRPETFVERKLRFVLRLKETRRSVFATVRIVQLPFELLARSAIKFKGKRVEAVSRNQAEQAEG